MERMGFRVLRRRRSPQPELVAGFKGSAVANVGDAMGRFGIMAPHIKSINGEGVSLLGVALTVRTRPGDNLMIHQALNQAQAGDVIVVDAQGSTTNGLWGELMTAYAQSKNVAGLVIDGAVRDQREIREMGFPVFSRAVVAAGGDKDGPGEVNIPISCGGVVVAPGDVIVGDEDGVAVIPLDHAGGVLERLAAIRDMEAQKLSAAKNGSQDRSWVDKALREKGCTFE